MNARVVFDKWTGESIDVFDVLRQDKEIENDK